jgi:phospholipid/cholesterol/gamma-HCH transport system substrate-binding protein
MMTRKELDLWVGIFAVIGIGALLFLSLKVANLASFTSADTYRINASLTISAD